MRLFTLLMILTMLTFNSDAQEKVNLLLGDVEFSFSGTKCLKPTADNFSKAYYNIEEGKLSYHLINYNENGDIFNYSLAEVLINELNLKSAAISDMKGDAAGSFDAWMLNIETKKLKDNVAYYMHTFLEPKPSKDDMFSISLLFNTEADAKSFIQQLKSIK